VEILVIVAVVLMLLDGNGMDSAIAAKRLSLLSLSGGCILMSSGLLPPESDGAGGLDVMPSRGTSQDRGSVHTSAHSKDFYCLIARMYTSGQVGGVP
jgi:hypothetical protein